MSGVDLNEVDSLDGRLSALADLSETKTTPNKSNQTDPNSGGPATHSGTPPEDAQSVVSVDLCVFVEEACWCWLEDEW